MCSHTLAVFMCSYFYTCSCVLIFIRVHIQQDNIKIRNSRIRAHMVQEEKARRTTDHHVQDTSLHDRGGPSSTLHRYKRTGFGPIWYRRTKLDAPHIQMYRIQAHMVEEDQAEGWSVRAAYEKAQHRSLLGERESEPVQNDRG